jgi:hypothetical protein
MLQGSSVRQLPAPVDHVALCTQKVAQALTQDVVVFKQQQSHRKSISVTRFSLPSAKAGLIRPCDAIVHL